ncbi:MAG: polysaccharide biosynthesis tyrosine autokinase [Lishizhenia sp.]
MKSNPNTIFINKEFDSDIFKIVFKRIWLILILIISFSIIGAFLYLRYTKNTYQSEMLIQISKEDTGKDVIDFQNINNTDNISAEIELLRSEFLFEMALKSLNLNVSHYSKGNILTENKYLKTTFNVTLYDLKDSSICNTPIFIHYDENSTNPLALKFKHKGKEYTAETKFNKTVETDFFKIAVKTANLESFISDVDENELYFVFNSTDRLIESYLPNLKIEPIDLEAKTIQISYRNSNAFLAKDITQAVGNAFFKYDNHIQKESAEKILAFISNQLDSLSTEVKLSRDSISRYQKTQKIHNPDAYSEALSENLNKLQDILFELEDEKYTLQLIKNKIAANTNRLDIYKLLPALYNKSFEQVLAKPIENLLNNLEKKEDLLFNVTDQNDAIKKINKKIEEDLIIVNKTIHTLEERIEGRKEITSNQILELERIALELPEKRIELNRLKELESLNEKYYTLLTEKKVLYSISNAGYTSSNKVLRRANTPKTPLSPNHLKIYLGFILFSLLIGALFFFYRYVSYNEINNIEDLRKILPENTSILGSVPLYKDIMKHSQLLVAEAPKSLVAEAMRNIRSNLTFIDAKAKLIAISSSISGEGKTFVALNLAGIIAVSGKKTILIDLDLRKPKVHFGVNTDNLKGISNILCKSNKIDECIKHTAVKNLDILTAGPIPPNPSELILSSEFDVMLKSLKEKYDIIIIDNPPVGIVSDGVKTLAESDIPIYVFKANYSNRQFVERIKELENLQKIKNLNVILNGVKTSKNKYGYGYGYGEYFEE